MYAASKRPSNTAPKNILFNHAQKICTHIQNTTTVIEEAISSLIEKISKEFFSAVALDHKPENKSNFTFTIKREEKSFCIYETKDKSSDEDDFLLVGQDGEEQVIIDHTEKFIEIYERNMNHLQTPDFYSTFLDHFNKKHDQKMPFFWSQDYVLDAMKQIKKSDFEYSVQIIESIFSHQK